MSTTSDLNLLGLDILPSVDGLKGRFRELALTLHPDVVNTGDTERFQAVREAYDRLLVLANEPKRCESCSGSGGTTVVRGFATMRIVCKSCRGLGAI